LQNCSQLCTRMARCFKKSRVQMVSVSKRPQLGRTLNKYILVTKRKVCQRISHALRRRRRTSLRIKSEVAPHPLLPLHEHVLTTVTNQLPPGQNGSAWPQEVQEWLCEVQTAARQGNKDFLLKAFQLSKLEDMVLQENTSVSSSGLDFPIEENRRRAFSYSRLFPHVSTLLTLHGLTQLLILV
jgi:hypothetical protein